MEDKLRALAAPARPNAEIIKQIAALMPHYAIKYEIDNPLRFAHFMAQLAHESDRFKTTVEYADGKAYNGRKDLGNVKFGDGPRYKGRGLIQLTGRANYREYGRKLGVDLEKEPQKAAEFPLALEIACLYWKERGLNAFADQNNIREITRRINGGFNGLADRQKLFARAQDLWAQPVEVEPPKVIEPPKDHVPVHRTPTLIERIIAFFRRKS